MKRYRLFALMMAAALLLTAAGCSRSMDMGSLYDGGGVFNGASGKTDYNYSADAPGDYAMELEPEYGYDGAAYNSLGENTGRDEGQFIEGAERKLIKNASYTMETLDYDSSIAAIERLISESGGYIQNSYFYGSGALKNSYYDARSAEYTVRVPAERFGAFGEALSQCGSVTYSNEFVNEVTDYYYDTAARIKSLQVREERLLELVSQATDITALIELEAALSDVRYQIESNQGTLRRLDSQVSYSTVTITLREVFEPTRVQTVPKTLGEKIAQQFGNTWRSLKEFAEGLIVFFAGNIIIFLLLAAFVVAVILLIKRSNKKHREKMAQSLLKEGADNEKKD